MMRHNGNGCENVNMGKDDVTKRRKLLEIVMEFTYIGRKPTMKSLSYGQISYREHACITCKHTCISIHCERTFQEIFTWYWGLYLWHIIHFTNSTFIRRSLLLYYQFVTRDWSARTFHIFWKIVQYLRTLIRQTIYSKANRIYFSLNLLRSSMCGGKGEEIAHIFRIQSFNTLKSFKCYIFHAGNI